MKISIINKRKSILSPLSLGEGLGVRLYIHFVFTIQLIVIPDNHPVASLQS